MKDFQKRVVNEKEELDANLEKLRSFIITPLYNTSPRPERDRLYRQSLIMDLYPIVLSERIANFI